MNEQQFHEEVDKLFLTIEEWLEKLNADLNIDIDFETQQSILTIFMSQGSQLVLSKQSALKEIWLASKIGAFHFQKTPLGWCTKQDLTLALVITNILNQQFELQSQIKAFE